MKRHLLSFAVACVAAAGAFAQSGAVSERAKFLIDGCFFSEMPTECEGRDLEVVMLKKEGGGNLMVISNLALTDKSKAYAMPSSAVPDAGFWIAEAAKDTHVRMSMKINAPEKTLLVEGDKLGSFAVRDLDGKSWGGSAASGRPMLLNFWHTGCGPCRKEMPEISAWVDEFPGTDFLAVTYNTPDEIKPVVADRGFRFVQIASDRTLWDMFGIKQTPTTVLVDASGTIRKVVVGTNREKRDIIRGELALLAAETAKCD